MTCFDHLQRLLPLFPPWVTVLTNGVYPQNQNGPGAPTAATSASKPTPVPGASSSCPAIDNLMKGQAAQAVQCFNIMNGLDENIGLPAVTYYP